MTSASRTCAADSQDRATIPAEVRDSSSTRRRVLVVEDDEDTRNSIRQLLELSLEVEVDLAAHGGEHPI